MIPNGRRGGSATGLVGYLAGKGNKNEHQDPHVIGGDQELLMLLPGQSHDLSRREVRVALASALEAPRRQTGVDVRLKNKTTGQYEHKHIAHWSLTLAPQDMRQPLSDAQWNWVAERFIEKMGLAGCRYAVVRHGDTVTGLGHVHIALNLVRPDGTRASTVRDWARAQQGCAQIASDLGLTMPHKQSRHLNAEQRGRALVHEPAEIGIRHELRQRVDTALDNATDAKMLATELRRHGVRWHNTNRDGRKGFSFSTDERSDIWIAGSEIDASRGQVGQRLKANASRAREEHQRQELELQPRIANDPVLVDYLKARSLTDISNPGPPPAGPLTPAEADPERSHLQRTRGPDLDNGSGR